LLDIKFIICLTEKSHLPTWSFSENLWSVWYKYKIFKSFFYRNLYI